MKLRLSFLSLAFVVLTANQSSFAREANEALVRNAVSADPIESATAIAELRSLGPKGLALLSDQYRDEISAHISNPALAANDKWQRITTALDRVAQQKNSYLSGLYWYTDLAEARKAAAESGKPILSLRLLGNLTDELSCANSRFFRTVLYANEGVSTVLRDRFILHWESVRPVPHITIDFGDGRKLERTITGNSIHYVLDSSGNTLDALPGLYGPQAFLRGLAKAESLFSMVNRGNEIERRPLLTKYYRERLNEISLAWLADTTKIGGKLPEGYSVLKGEKGEALSIMPLAVTKAITEAMILRSMTAGSEALGSITDEAAWARIAALHSDDAKLDERSISLMRHQSQNLDDKSFARQVEKFQSSVRLDTVRNEYLMHSKLYALLVADKGRSDVNELNEKVYAELFLTPRTDSWLGLLATDVYTGIENGGVVKQ